MVRLKEELQSGLPFPRLVFVNMGSDAAAEAFFAERWPQAASIQDPKQELYKGFEIPMGPLGQFFRSPVYRAFWKARKHGVGLPQGNTFRSQGAVLLYQKLIVHSQAFEHYGEMIDIGAFREKYLQLEHAETV
ncbi:MAG: hypothetical protein AB8B55_08910 [Mariniblastus sp.]